MLIPGHRGIKVRNSLKSPHYFVIFRKNATKPYSSLPSEAVFANSTGILVVAFGLLVLYILLASPWKRPDPGTLTDRQVWLLVPIHCRWGKARSREGPRKVLHLAEKIDPLCQVESQAA